MMKKDYTDIFTLENIGEKCTVYQVTLKKHLELDNNKIEKEFGKYSI